MSKLRIADFYYGAVLSILFNKGITPVLVESSNDRQVYDFTTDNGDFRLFIKYRSESRAGKNADYNSWQFTFTYDDIKSILQYIDEQLNIILALVCGRENLEESELAIITAEEIKQCLGSGKKSFTISRAKREKAFRISIGGGRANSVLIPSNRILG